MINHQRDGRPMMSMREDAHAQIDTASTVYDDEDIGF